MKNIYIDTRHSTAESKGTSDCKINLPSNNKYFITQHSILLILQFLYVGIQLKLTKMIQYMLESMVPITPLLNALFLKETLTQLHLGLLCVKL